MVIVGDEVKRTDVVEIEGREVEFFDAIVVFDGKASTKVVEIGKSSVGSGVAVRVGNANE